MIYNRRTIIGVFTIVGFVLLMAVACGGGNKPQAAETQTPVVTSVAPTTTPTVGSACGEVTADDIEVLSEEGGVCFVYFTRTREYLADVRADTKSEYLRIKADFEDLYLGTLAAEEGFDVCKVHWIPIGPFNHEVTYREMRTTGCVEEK